MFQTICPECGRMSFGWGWKCPYCGANTETDKTECYLIARDYDDSVKEVNEPDHDLEYHDKKCEGG